ncbi:hypothetical protein KEHDKFFH_18775 [Marinobacter maroccanus]|uniref:DUF4382 domain-containing protein n=1 Tax=Marinobacter maroccanus TaxID=2055143 RepID=A0A2S5Z5B1_9GAMM|nr:DUF4382 domain-containing protein [Marinobacter maroccanus]PPI82540.1 hypothetical protein KEHDKFFH_18775 [Marinobacter maroccanus]
MKRSIRLFTVSALAAGIAACGGSGDGSSTSSTGTVNVGLTDAPVDSAQEVNIEVEALVLQHSNGERSRFEFDMAEPVNLLALTGGTVMSLLADEEVAAGDYSWMRLELGDGNNIVINGGQFDLTTPSARGVQTSGFIVPAGGQISLTIDFDVRKSIVNPQNNPDVYRLKPVIRLVDNSEVGTIAGTVAGEVIISQCSEENAGSTDTFNGSVYIHEGFDVAPDDIGSDQEPLVAVPVNYKNDQYVYTAAFIPEGEYTVSYTCGDDQIETAEGEPSDDELTFITGDSQVEVVSGETNTVNFEASTPE